MDQKFYAITVISNPMRFKVRYDLYRQFAAHMEASGAKLITVEMAFGSRPFEITDSGNPFHVQLRSFEELWHKENMINLGIQRLAQLDPHWEYVAWLDADISFVRKDWVLETVHQLQHHHVVQLFSECLDLGPSFQIIQTHKSFVSQFFANDFLPPQGPGWGGYNAAQKAPPAFWHPGYAWAARREAMEALGSYLGGPLMDFPILGAGDHHMALALIGEAARSVPGAIHSGYLRGVMQWQERATAFIRRDIGFVPGTIVHYWHGKKKDRKYVERWDILTGNNFDPTCDIYRDSSGLWQLELNSAPDRQLRLRDQIRAYFRQRNEDSTDTI